MPDPHRKPTLVKRLEGNPGKRPINNLEPEPTGPAVRPDFLDGEAMAEWDRAISAMPPGLYTAADVPVLSVYCLAWSTFRAAYEVTLEDGLTDVGSTGQTVAHPMLAVMAKQSEIILRASDKLGMSPVARTRIEMKGEAKLSEFERLSRPPVAANG